jgi:hypothetical protein
MRCGRNDGRGTATVPSERRWSSAGHVCRAREGQESTAEGANERGEWASGMRASKGARA